MTFNEFQRELQRRNIDKQTAYMFTLQYERMIHMAKEIEDTAKAVLALANTIAGFVQLNEVMNERIKQLSKMGREDGVDVASVANDPDEDKRH